MKDDRLCDQLPFGHKGRGMIECCTSYQLWIDLRQAVELNIGRLGTHSFSSGWYVYAGQARRHLRARLRRHCADPEDKARHWHIDYLLAHPAATIRWIALSQGSECQLNAGGGGRLVCPGFGASDCRVCISHLRYLGEV